jgi:hypothetical protein
MHAIHWIRSQQEERELTYWLSFVALDHRDRSLNNRIYLLYLVLFFSAWIFVTLTFFAGSGAFFLRMLNPDNPIRAATTVEVFLLGVWGLYKLWQSCKRSPVIFSEQDAVLICQMPVNRRLVVMRWLLMPWLESAIPFWLVAITLGFSLAEITLPGVMKADYLPAYIGYGMRAWLTILPVHLAMFSLNWAVGIFRLQKDLERRWLAWPVITSALMFLSFLLFSLLDTSISSLSPLDVILKIIIYPIQAGLGQGNLFIGLFWGGILALIMLGILYRVSSSFSLSRSAQETHEMEVINSMLRYGFISYAQQLQTQQRLGISRKSAQLPELSGASALIWKDLLQFQRSFRWSDLYDWSILFCFMFGLSFFPDLNSRAFLIILWVIRIGKVSVIRVRSDLSCWSLVRQLPITRKKLLLFDLSSAYFFSIMISLAGLGIGSIISRMPVGPLAILVPGIVAGIAGITAFDVIRRSRNSLLINGSVPEISAGAILLGVLFAAVPLLIITFLPGFIGLLLSIFSSLLLGGIAFNLAVGSYRNIDVS